MHGGHTSEDEPMAEMNFIPLIDIALTLVIILMVTTAFIRQPGVALRLPQTVTREGAPETNKDLIVNIAADGGLYLDGQRQTAAALQARLRKLAAQNNKARVLVRGDRAAVYARVMEVMDMVRQAGLTRVVLPTDPKHTATPEPKARKSRRSRLMPAARVSVTTLAP
jgi:biopolymer transport protein TolR